MSLIAGMCLMPENKNLVTPVKGHTSTDECQLTPVIHVLQYPGCVPKPIPSFACIGRCASYLQVIKRTPRLRAKIQSERGFYREQWALKCQPNVLGIWKQNLANGTFVHVLPRIWRT